MDYLMDGLGIRGRSDRGGPSMQVLKFRLFAVLKKENSNSINPNEPSTEQALSSLFLNNL